MTMPNNPEPSDANIDTPNRYKIEKITDIFQIPEDKFKDFLTDFETFYTLGKSMVELVDTVAEVSGLNGVKTVPTHMVWIDDGKHDAKVYLKPQERLAALQGQ